MINGSAINGAVINGNAIVTIQSETLTTAVALSNVISPEARTLVISSLDLNNALTSSLGKAIAIESLILSDFNSNKQITKETVLNYLNVVDSSIITMKATATESIAFTTVSTVILRGLLEVINTLDLATLSSTKATFRSTLVTLLTLIGTNEKLYLERVTGSIAFTDTITLLLSALTSISTDLLVTSTSSNKSLFLVSLETDSTFSDSYSTSARFKEVLLSTISFLIPDSDSPTGYTTYAFSPETSSITEYDNYKFDGATKFGSKYLFYNSTGLYEYGGVTDNTTPILIDFMTAATTFKKSNLKRVPTVYMGLSSNNAVYLKVKVDGKAEVTYKLNKHTDNLQTQKIDIGKGLVGRYFQFEVLTYSTDFNMESIEFFPIEIERKI